MPKYSPYSGTERKLVLAFDVGTTYSGISYVILDPGREPEIKSVTRFPSQERVGWSAKIPTVIYYDSNGAPRAVGAETEREGVDALAEESGWIKAEWFKLHLKPRTKETSFINGEIPPLLAGKTVVDVLADFLRYLNSCTRIYIEETEFGSASLLTSGKVEFILSHPNAWEGAQQTLMRRAAVQAGLIADSASDRERITFISEGEASLNFCIDKDLEIAHGEGVTIVDAGGGTLDISTYARKPDSSNEYEEIAASQSHFKGSVFVTRAAAKHLRELLHDTRFQDDIPFMIDKFDKTTKLAFRDPKDSYYIKFGSARDRATEFGIQSGRLRLDGHTIATFFGSSIQTIVAAVTEQRRLSLKQVSTVFFVGGFAASDYLFSEVQRRLQCLGFNIHRPDAHVNKAVPDGAIVGWLCPTVRTRTAKYSYGVEFNTLYEPTNPEHRKRSAKRSQWLSGEQRVPGSFGQLLKKGTQVSETEEFRESFFYEARKKSELRKQNSTTITVYRGGSSPPEFIDQDPENFYEVFEVQADLNGMIDKLKPVKGKGGKHHFELDYEVIILFGKAEFKAQYAWYEDGIEKRGPAEILFDTDIDYQK